MLYLAINYYKVKRDFYIQKDVGSLKPIFLIGFMGSGKSTVGRAISERYHLSFVDLDDYIVKKNRMEITKIFEKYGEGRFRKLEHEALQEVLLKNIIATGGGIVEQKDNISLMKEKGTIIYLHASYDEIDRRLQGDQTRPLWLNNDFKQKQQLYNKRDALYRACADYIISTDSQTVNDIITNIMDKIPFVESY